MRLLLTISLTTSVPLSFLFSLFLSKIYYRDISHSSNKAALLCIDNRSTHYNHNSNLQAHYAPQYKGSYCRSLEIVQMKLERSIFCNKLYDARVTKKSFLFRLQFSETRAQYIQRARVGFGPHIQSALLCPRARG